MAFCAYCGNPLQDGDTFCGNCGSPVEQQPAAEYQQPAAEYQQAAPQYQQAAPQYQQAAPVQIVDNDVAASRGVAWLSYLGLLWLIPFFVKKHYRFARFHVRQGATLFACELAYTLTYKLILLPIDLATREIYFGYVIHSGFYNVMNTIFGLGEIFFVVIAVMGIVRAASGKMIELPLIGKIPFIKTLIDKWYTGMGVDVTND